MTLWSMRCDECKGIWPLISTTKRSIKSFCVAEPIQGNKPFCIECYAYTDHKVVKVRLVEVK